MNPQHFESLYPPQTREREIGELFQYIKAGSSCQLVGIPGAGRTNTLGFLTFNKSIREYHLKENEKWLHFVYMDFSEVKKRDLYEVIKFILISLSYSLAERQLTQEHTTVNEFLKEAIEFKDELVLFQTLKKSIDFLSIQKELSVVFLFDRFDQYIPNINDQFFINLKILRNRAKYRFATVFALPRPIEDLIEASIYSEFYEFVAGNVVYVSLYDEVGIKFRLEYLEKATGKTMPENIKKEIIDMTGGHGKLVRIAYEKILSENIQDNLKDSESILEFLQHKSQVQGALYEIWNELSPDEQNFLQDKNRSLDDPAAVYLNNVGLLKNNTITIPLFEAFIATATPPKEEKITYDAEKNEIIMGSEAITDRLSPSEFRLLRYLVQNTGKICEKDEIIANVWTDLKTQEGVTDQALDQIIYRLRKKIEHDPNNPIHIHTIKGRGYRFIA